MFVVEPASWSPTAFLHQWGATQLGRELTLGLWWGLQPQAYLLLLLLPGFPAVLAPQLLALLLGQVHRKQHGLHRGRCEATPQLFPILFAPLCDRRESKTLLKLGKKK